MNRDLVIIGGGPGGYEAAIRGAQLGKSVTLIEQDRMGGTCLNRGCIPTKAFYKNAETVNTLKGMSEFGVSLGEFNFDMSIAQKRKSEIVNKLVTGVDQLLKGNNVEVIKGKASFKTNKIVQVETQAGIEEITADNIIIATGSSSSSVPVPGIHLSGVISSDEILNFEEVPKRLVVLGGGVVGVEFAGIFASLGSEVTIVEFLPKILFRLDDELSRKLSVYLKKQGIKIMTGTGLKEVQQAEDGLIVIVENEKGKTELNCDYLLTAAGRKPNTDGLNLEAAGIEYDRKGIKVDENYKTSAQGVYAIGDAIGGIMLAHISSEEGKACVEKLCGHSVNVNYNAVPSCVFTFPEVSTVGMTEDEAKANNIEYLVGKSMFGANGKALTMGEGEGFIKVMAEKESHKIIGVHIMGPHASDIIHDGSMAISNNLTIEDIKESVFAHPTLSEVFYEAVCGCIGEAIHTMPKRK